MGSQIVLNPGDRSGAGGIYEVILRRGVEKGERWEINWPKVFDTLASISLNLFNLVTLAPLDDFRDRIWPSLLAEEIEGLGGYGFTNEHSVEIDEAALRAVLVSKKEGLIAEAIFDTFALRREPAWYMENGVDGTLGYLNEIASVVGDRLGLDLLPEGHLPSWTEGPKDSYSSAVRPVAEVCDLLGAGVRETELVGSFGVLDEGAKIRVKRNFRGKSDSMFKKSVIRTNSENSFTKAQGLSPSDKCRITLGLTKK